MHAAAYVLGKLFRTALIGLALKQGLPALTGINIAVTKKVTLEAVLRQIQLKLENMATIASVNAKSWGYRRWRNLSCYGKHPLNHGGFPLPKKYIVRLSIEDA